MADQSQPSGPGTLAATQRVRLRDGALVVIRPLVGSDRLALAAAIMRLSPHSRYLRFASPMPVLRDAELDRLLDLDHVRREALVAFEPAGGRGIGVARYATFASEPGVADVAVTVDDAWQRRGVGAVLLAAVLERARANGVRTLRASTLAENRAARALLRRAGFSVRGREGLLIEHERRLDSSGWLSLAAAS